MSVPVIRIVAAIVVVFLSGLPVAGVLCAHECTAVEQGAHDADSQCHETASADAVGVRADAPDDCNPFAATETVTRERGTSPFKDAPVLAAVPLRRLVLPADGARTPRPRGRAPAITALPPGTLIPLRI